MGFVTPSIFSIALGEVEDGPAEHIRVTMTLSGGTWRVTAARIPIDLLKNKAGLSEPLGSGLDIIQVQSSRSREGDSEVIKVEGQIRNPLREKKIVPNVRVALTNSEREEVVHVVIIPQASELGFEGRTHFVALLRNPPPTARNVEVSFTDEQVDPSRRR